MDFSGLVNRPVLMLSLLMRRQALQSSNIWSSSMTCFLKISVLCVCACSFNHSPKGKIVVRMFEISDRIEQLVTIRFDPKAIHLYEIFEYLFKRNIYKEGLLLTLFPWRLTLLEVFILDHYGPPGRSTGRTQQLTYNTNHKQGATKLLKLGPICTQYDRLLTWY